MENIYQCQEVYIMHGCKILLRLRIPELYFPELWKKEVLKYIHNRVMTTVTNICELSCAF